MQAAPVKTRRALPWGGVVVGLEANPLRRIKCGHASRPTCSGGAALELDAPVAGLEAGPPRPIKRRRSSRPTGVEAPSLGSARLGTATHW